MSSLAAILATRDSSLPSLGSFWNYKLERLSCCTTKEPKDLGSDRPARMVREAEATEGLEGLRAPLISHHRSEVTRGLEHEYR